MSLIHTAFIDNFIRGSLFRLGMVAFGGWITLDSYEAYYYYAHAGTEEEAEMEKKNPWRVYEVDVTSLSRRRLSMYYFPRETTERFLTMNHPKNGHLVRARPDLENPGWVQLPCGYFLPLSSCGVKMLHEVPAENVPEVMKHQNYYRRKYRPFDYLSPRTEEEDEDILVPRSISELKKLRAAADKSKSGSLEDETSEKDVGRSWWKKLF